MSRIVVSPILVTGATGNVGRHVAEELMAAGQPHRLASRSGLGQAGRADQQPREHVAFDYTDPDTWDTAFAGVETMFCVRPPTLTKVGRDLLPALSAARDAGVSHVVFLSVQGADRNRLLPHAGVETWLRDSGLTWTFLRASYFIQNLTTVHAADIRERDAIILPAGQGRTAFVDARDVAAVAVAALRDPAAHAGRAWTVTGPRAATYAEVAALLSAELERPIRYANPNVAAYLWHVHRRLGMPLPLAALTVVLYTTARLGLAGRTSDDVRVALNRPALSLARSLHLERAAWLTHQPGRSDRAAERRTMDIAVLGATGRTGRLLVAELIRRGHTVRALVRDPGKLATTDGLRVVEGDSRDATALRALIDGADAVVSALGPVGGDTTVHSETARELVAAMTSAGVGRYVGVSGAGIDVPGDRKSLRDKIVSRLIQTLGGAAVADKPREHRVFADSSLNWTLVSPRVCRMGRPVGRWSMRPPPRRAAPRCAGPTWPGLWLTRWNRACIRARLR